MSDYTELKALAEAANAGPWYVANGMSLVRDNADEFVCETGENDPVNADFIAAANPSAVLKLIVERDQLKAESELLRNGESTKAQVYQHSAASERAELEAAAKKVYEQWAGQPGYLPWVDYGNSIMQDKARSAATKAAKVAK